MGKRDIVARKIETKCFSKAYKGVKHWRIGGISSSTGRRRERGRSCGSSRRHSFGFHHDLLTRFGGDVGMGVRDNVAKYRVHFTMFEIQMRTSV